MAMVAIELYRGMGSRRTLRLCFIAKPEQTSHSLWPVRLLNRPVVGGCGGLNVGIGKDINFRIITFATARSE